MKNNPFALDVVLPPVTDDVTLPPVTEFELFANDYGWIICIAALIVIAATIGIILFMKRKKENKK